MEYELSNLIPSYAVVFGCGAILGAIVLAMGLSIILGFITDIARFVEWRREHKDFKISERTKEFAEWRLSKLKRKTAENNIPHICRTCKNKCNTAHYSGDDCCESWVTAVSIPLGNVPIDIDITINN